MTALSTAEQGIPPLEAGDRLTRQEFRRRYAASPHIKKAELIDGVVYVASPTKRRHGVPDLDLSTWIGLYRSLTPGVEGFSNTTVVLDEDNEPQPDIALRIIDSGRCRVDADDYLQGAPELVVEVSNSSTSYDLHQKREVYRRHGVREYVVLQVREARVRWFELKAGELMEREPDADGLYRSAAFPGLWLDAEALIAGDLARVLDAVRRGADTPEHAAFVESLGTR